MSKRKFNPEIDLLKFIFSIVIVLYHSKYIFGMEGCSLFPYGFTGVEFFFMVSGFLMVKSSKKFDATKLGRSTADFIINKIKTIYPHFFFAFIVAFAVRQVSFFIDKGYDIIDFGKDAITAISEALFLMKTGVEFGTIYNGPTWYIGAMLIGMAVLFPVLLKHREWFLNIGSLVIAIFCYGYAYQVKGTINYLDWSGFTTMSIIRAIAGLCLGCFIYAMVERVQISGISLKRTGKILLWLVEVGLIGLLLAIMQLEGKNSFDYIAIILILFICFIMFSGLTGIQNILPPKFCSFLGKCSLLLYLNHRYVTRFLNLVLPDITWEKAIVLYIVITIIMAFVCEIVVTGCKLFWNKISPTVKSLVFEK